MDGVGERKESFGNAVQLACTPTLDYLKKTALYTQLKAHGPAVGLPSDGDMGNSEVGHNALGAGKIYDQGAKLVQASLKSGEIFRSPTWTKLMHKAKDHTLHFIGLLSDGLVHSHEDHLYALLRQACQEQQKKIRVHVLFDGRDVAEKSAEIYVERLEKVLSELRQLGCDAQVASGGGRMQVTMDRYEADWSIVERGWKAHVLGQSQNQFPSLPAAVKKFRENHSLGDQNFPDFVIINNKQPVGPIIEGDAVVMFNFRGDRALEICAAFEQADFQKFDRQRFPNVFFAGMLEYDGDLHVPNNYLVAPPSIQDTLGAYLAGLGVSQFACSETQKFGHVTYFWNGNRSGYFDKKLEEYLEIPSDRVSFEQKPWMKAYEITEATLKRIYDKRTDFMRINFANGDMVGHTGDLEAAVIAVATVDFMLSRLLKACIETNTILVVTADHGNCEEMFDAQNTGEYKDLSYTRRPRPKTSHTLAPVPFLVFDPKEQFKTIKIAKPGELGLTNVANTLLLLLGLATRPQYNPSILT